MGCSASVAVFNRSKISANEGECVLADRFWEPDIIMSIEEKFIVKSQWQQISTQNRMNGKSVFMKIFESYPEIKELFGIQDVEANKFQYQDVLIRQGLRIMHTVGLVISNIDNLENSIPNQLRLLGKRHFFYTGFKPEYVEAFYNAFWSVWKEGLGTSYTDDAAKAWRQLFLIIFENLKKGYHLAAIEEVTRKALTNAHKTEKEILSRFSLKRRTRNKVKQAEKEQE